MMMKDNIKKLRKASEGYILNNKEGLTEKTLEYIQNRIKENEEEIKKLIELKKEKITYEDIEKAIVEEIEKNEECKSYSNLLINKDKFLSVEIKMPVGIIAVEAYETIDVIKYYIKAIISRNAIAISDVEYEENNLKALILIIIQEALKKFEIDENLIILLPYEECFYEEFDETIYTYEKNGKKIQGIEVEKKEHKEKMYVYIEEASLRTEALKNTNAEVMEGNIENIIEKLNKEKVKAVTMYTKDTQKAFEFINLVNAENIFINTSLENVENVEKSKNILYENRKIIIPLPQSQKEEKNEQVKEEYKNVEGENTQLIIRKKENIFSKIKEILKRIFKK